jgi:hypothetical protein
VPVAALGWAAESCDANPEDGKSDSAVLGDASAVLAESKISAQPKGRASRGVGGAQRGDI